MVAHLPSLRARVVVCLAELWKYLSDLPGVHGRQFCRRRRLLQPTSYALAGCMPASQPAKEIGQHLNKTELDHRAGHQSIKWLVRQDVCTSSGEIDVSHPAYLKHLVFNCHTNRT